MNLGTVTAIQCQQAFAAGDLAFFNANRCNDSAGNQQLIDAKRKEINTKTYVIVGAGILAVGAIIFFSTRK